MLSTGGDRGIREKVWGESGPRSPLGDNTPKDDSVRSLLDLNTASELKLFP